MDWQPFAEIVENHQRFLVTSHVRPDGDALGSCLGMVGILRHLGKDVRVVLSSPVPTRYDFLDPKGTIFERFGERATPENLADREVVVILDLSSWSQLERMSDWVREFPGKRVVIDHHVSQDEMNALVLKDVSVEATGRLVLDAARALRIPIDEEMATGLLTAIAMDTGWFAHANTSAETFRAAAELVEAGAPAHEIHRLLFKRNTLGRMRLMGETIASLSSERDGKLVYAKISREDLKRTGAAPSDAEDLVDLTFSLKGVVVGLLFMELMGGGIKVSARSRQIDCAKLLKAFGGGGHKAAAGATLSWPMDEAVARVLEAVRRELDAPGR